MTGIRNKPGGRPAKSRIDKQNRVVSTKLTELQFYAIIEQRATLQIFIIQRTSEIIM